MNTESITLHTRLLRGSEQAYEQAHEAMSLEVKAVLRRAGFTRWQIFRDGQNLFHLVECEDYRRSMERFLADPIGDRWQTEMGELQEPNLEGRIRSPMLLIWTL